jgi:DNA polymerase III delta prime subunit
MIIKNLKEIIKNVSRKICIYNYLYNETEGENENIKIYELTPSININDDSYLDYLKAAIDKKSITNIALSGPYGSGKSSILKAFKKRLFTNSNYKFLNISLATFKDKDEETELTLEEYVAIEKSILQQIFYSVEQYEIPNSRFKRIKFDKNLYKNSLYFSLWITSIIELFSPYTFVYHYSNKYDLTFVFSVIFAIGFIKFSKLIFEKTSNIKLSKFIVQNQEISFDNETQTSILNANIDEILYFFNATKYNVVIIEDLDRFNNLEIFIKLREINTLLNNRNSKDKITFIYAIKDDMFKDKDRTKFFDYIIPVVPFINSSNSFKKLRELLINENLLNENNEKDTKKVDEKFIKDISTYINDMRFLINVFNEFIQYTKKLGKEIELDYNSLFAISLYKNYKPDDFAKLHNNEGILYTIFSNNYKHKILDNITVNLKNEITELTKKIDAINSLMVQNIEELRSLYIYHLINHVKQSISQVYINDSRYEILNLIQNQFEEFSKSSKTIYYIPSINGYQTNSNITFKQLEKLVDENYTYEEKKAAIEQKNLNSIDELKNQRLILQNNLSHFKRLPIQELLNKSEINTNIVIDRNIFNKCLFDKKVLEEEKKVDISKDDLLMYLLRYGHIKEDYFKYISYYHPGQETPNDINFILNLQRNAKALAYDLELTHFEYIFTELNSENQFSNVAILNYSLINALLNNIEAKINLKYTQDAINSFVKLLSSNFNEYFNFIDGFINNYNDSSILKYILVENPNFWEFILTHSDLSINTKNKYFYFIFNLDVKNKIEFLEEIDNNSSLSQYIINKKTFNGFVNNINDFESFKELINRKGIKFKRLDDIESTSENFNFIYKNNFYRINYEWIIKILHSHTEEYLKSKNYSSILNSNKPELISYINKNINEYVENILLINGNLKDDEKDIIQLLNNEELKVDNKIIIVDRLEKPFSDISLITNFSWEYLLANNKISPTPHNIQTCIGNKKVDNKSVQKFINLENTYRNIFNIPNLYDHNEIESLKLEEIIFDNEQIDKNVFISFLKSIKYKYELFPDNIEKEFMQQMVELNKVHTNIENYQILVDRDFNELVINLFENEPHTLIENFDEFNIDNEILVKLVLSSKFNDKQKISLFNLSNIEELIKFDNELNSLRELLFTLKVNNFEELNNGAFDVLMLSTLDKNKKIELFIKYKFKDRNDVTNSLINLSSSFEKITQFVSGPIIFKKDEYNLKLLKRLKEINYISSFIDKNKEVISIYTFQSEKEIIIS